MSESTSNEYQYPLPVTEAEFLLLKENLTQYHGVTDKPEVWYTIASHIQSQKPSQVTITLKELANVGRKVIINQVAQDQKLIEADKIQRKLEEVALKVAIEAKQEERNRERTLEVPEPDGSDVSDRTHRL